MYISTSILSIKEDIKKIKEMDSLATDFIHLDVMDGCFVENKVSFESINFLNKPLDIHFMVEKIYDYVDKYLHLNPVCMTFHIELEEDIEKVIQYIKSKNIKVGISLKPNTSIEKIKPYLNKIDLILVMTVEPGYGSQSFMEAMIPKIEQLKEIREKEKFHYMIEVDGGINQDTYQKCIEADILVIGSYITKSDNPKASLENIKNNL